MRLSTILGAIYLLIGVLVAASNDYLERLGTIRAIISALLAIVLWPLVLLGFDVDIRRR
jgi:vacuolar-type H+-ATPase subunit I/STV1